MQFLGLWKIKFCMAKKGFFFIWNFIKHYFWSYFDWKQIKKNICISDQKHRLTLLEKWYFWDFEILNLVWPKEVSFLYRTLLNIISSFILTENLTKEKITFFDPKRGLTPLEKCNFLGLWKTGFFMAKKVFFSI